VAWDEKCEPAYRDWAEELNLSLFGIGQRAGLEEWPIDDEARNGCEIVTAALVGLVHRVSGEIVPALRAGGVEGLLVVLWCSRPLRDGHAITRRTTGRSSTSPRRARKSKATLLARTSAPMRGWPPNVRHGRVVRVDKPNWRAAVILEL
jgi:hypothetical protein